MPETNSLHDPYGFLEKISTEELKRLLREDALSDGEGSPENDEFITRAAEIVARREKDGPNAPVFDADASWAGFQEHYRPAQGELTPLTGDTVPAKAPEKRKAAPKRLVQRLGALAAAICVFMGLLVAAQAMGLDVFGAIARWTDSTFHHQTAPVSGEVAQLRAALEEQGFPAELAPTWVPEGLKAVEPNVVTTTQMTMVTGVFSSEETDVVYTVTRCVSPEIIEQMEYEKDAGEVTTYSNGSQAFYIFPNAGTLTATWTDGVQYTIDICGDLDMDTMTAILDSIGR